MLKSMRDTFNESEYRPMNALVPGSRRCAMRIGIGNPRTARFLKLSDSWTAICATSSGGAARAEARDRRWPWGFGAPWPPCFQRRRSSGAGTIGSSIRRQAPAQRQAEARSLLTKIPYAETQEEAERQKRAFQAWCRSTATPTSAARSTATGSGWSRSTTSPASTGRICGRRTRWSRPSRPYDPRPRPSGSRRSRTRRR